MFFSIFDNTYSRCTTNEQVIEPIEWEEPAAPADIGGVTP